MQRLGLSQQRSNCVDDDDDDGDDDDDIGDDDDDGDGKALNRMFGGKATLMLLIHRSITAIACRKGRTQPDELHNIDIHISKCMMRILIWRPSYRWANLPITAGQIVRWKNLL